ncbi:hypothetical protein LDENG_00277100, partial [Lucifuga dentata]
SLCYFKSRLRSVAFLTHGSTSLQRVTHFSRFQAETLNKTWSDQVMLKRATFVILKTQALGSTYLANTLIWLRGTALSDATQQQQHNTNSIGDFSQKSRVGSTENGRCD